jgi:diketogulonate reductase-like aldo/keto reductase
MHPDWEQLMSAYNSDSSVLIANADCQKQNRKPGTGSSLCKAEHLGYFPYILYGKGEKLQPYNGDRSFAALKKFVESHKDGSSNGPSPNAHLPVCPDTNSTDAVKNVKLNNGVEMPLISLGVWQYDSSTAQSAVKLALQTGFNHIDTALDYNNQDGVGAALKGVDRKTYFLTTKVPPVQTSSSAYAETAKDLETDLKLLGLDYVDLMLIHGPAQSCKATQEQWRALEDFYKAGKAKAIGVSNYCASSFKCINETAKVIPTVNQIAYHIGMGPDPQGLKSLGDSLGVVTQAYSPLGDGTSELITGKLVSDIGKAHGWSGAQVSMRWILDNGVALTTKTNKQSHMKEDLAIFSDALKDTEKKQLDDAKSPAGRPSWACSSDLSVMV